MGNTGLRGFLVKAALAARSPEAIGHGALPSLMALYVSKPGYRSPATCLRV